MDINYEERVMMGDNMHEIMDDEDPIMEAMEDCAGSACAAMDGCARIFHHRERNRIVIKERYVEPDYPRLPSEGNLEWQYTMRRTMQEVIPGLFLGPYASATRAKLEEMKAAGLTHIVCVRQNLEKNLIRPNHPDHFKYLVVEIADSATENIIPHFKLVNAFLNECLASGGKALVHGNAGISRSAALVIAFIMSKHGVTLKEAFSFVQSKRFCCNPNEGFMAQLREYEPIYRALHTVPLPLPGDTRNRSSVKRGLDLEDGDGNVTPSTASVMDTSGSGAGAVGLPQAMEGAVSSTVGVGVGIGVASAAGGAQSGSFSSSSESSSSESLPHVISIQHHQIAPSPQMPPPPPQSTDTPMSMS